MSSSSMAATNMDDDDTIVTTSLSPTATTRSLTPPTPSSISTPTPIVPSTSTARTVTSTTTSTTSITSLTSLLSQLTFHFESQFQSLREVQEGMREHYDATLIRSNKRRKASMDGEEEQDDGEHEEEDAPPSSSINPIDLLHRLSLATYTLHTLSTRTSSLLERRSSLLSDAEALRDANHALIASLETRLQPIYGSSNGEMYISNGSMTPLKNGGSTKLLKERLSISASSPSSGSSTPLRRKSLSLRQPPSPSHLIEQALLEHINTSSELEGPVSEKEFACVSSTVKSRVKLVDVNHMLSVIQAHFHRYVQAHKIKDASSALLPPLTLTTLSEEGGIKIGGASSQCMIGTLRACKRIVVSKAGISLVKPPVWSATIAAVGGK